MKFLNVVENKKYYLLFAAAIVLGSWLCVLFLGLKPGIDLSGGTDWQIAFTTSTPSIAEIQSTLSAAGVKELSVQILGTREFTIETPEMSEADHEQYAGILKSKLGDFTEENFSSIGPTIGSELARKSITAIILVLIGISIYIAYAFRKVSEPVKSWKYGLVTLITLVHDVSIPTGFLALLGYFKGIEIDTNFIVALLVIMGFSVHDTIVVFDRIRENLLVARGKKISLGEIIDYSVRETFARSVNTSFTLVLVLVALLVFGPQSLFYFILTMLIGTIFGTYSSIFVASPLLYLWQKKEK